MIEIAHERAARQLAGDLTGRAAHIDVDQIGAQARGDAGALLHPMRLAAGKLDSERAQLTARGTAHDVGALTDQLLAGDHLRHDEAGPQAMCDAAERQIGHPDIGAGGRGWREVTSDIEGGFARPHSSCPTICPQNRHTRKMPFICAE
jgi:hypothetical protein